MKKMQKNTISENRKNYLSLFQDYQRIDRFKNIRKRIGENKHKRSMIAFLGLVGFDFISYLVSLFCFYKSYNMAVLVYWGILFLITVIFLIKYADELESYRNEMIVIRDGELCELLKNNNINLQNITIAVEYFKLELEPMDEVYKKYPILNSISSFGSNLFSLILGIIVSSFIKEQLGQNGIQIYGQVIVVLVLILIVILIIKAYIYIDKKDKYVEQIRKLIIDLKRIELLNRSK